MRKRLLFCAFVALMTSCQQEDAIQPSSSTLAGEVVGTYRTNVYLDPSSVAIPSDQMPYTEIKGESDSSVTLVYTNTYPSKEEQSLKHVMLSRQANGIQLRSAGLLIGTLQTDRIFTNSGMEKQGKLLRISLENDSKNPLYFTGSR